MLIAFLGILILLLGLLPQFWAQKVMRRHSNIRNDLKWTGGDLARELLDKLHMPHVKIESNGLLDYYDPVRKTILLSSHNFKERSLTAVVTAAHETGHAIQDKSGYYPLFLRNRLVGMSQVAQRIGSVVFLLSPIVAAVLRGPIVGLIMMVIAAISMGLTTLVHLLTLPVELDASFRRALPILLDAGIITAKDYHSARQILRACAFSYLASSLASLVSIWRWIKFLRR